MPRWPPAPAAPWRTSPAGGRLALLLRPGLSPPARRLARRLRDYGFERIRLRARAEGDLLLVCRMQPAIR